MAAATRVTCSTPSRPFVKREPSQTPASRASAPYAAALALATTRGLPLRGQLPIAQGCALRNHPGRVRDQPAAPSALQREPQRADLVASQLGAHGRVEGRLHVD